MKKKLMALFLLLVMVFTVFPWNAVEAQAADIASDVHWAELMYQYIMQDQENTDADVDTVYELIYLDEDQIPELWVDRIVYASGCSLVTYYNQEIYVENMSSGCLLYTEKENRFLYSWSFQGMGSDQVYTLENGQLEKITAGSYNYYTNERNWNDRPISEQEYESEKNKWVPTATAKSTTDKAHKKYRYEEILSYLKTLFSPDKLESITDFFEAFGWASTEPFVSCVGATMKIAPASICGIISLIEQDINHDRQKEIILLRTRQEQKRTIFLLEVYTFDEDCWSLSAQHDLTFLDYCEEVYINFFYNLKLETYCVYFEADSSGAYTGVNCSRAGLFQVTMDLISEYQLWSPDPWEFPPVDYATQIKDSGVPASIVWNYDMIHTDNAYLTICTIEHSISDYNDINSRKHILQIKENSHYQRPLYDLRVFSALPSDTIGVGQKINLLFRLYEDDRLKPIESYVMGISNPSVLDNIDTYNSDGARIITLQGLKSGTSDVTFTDNSTGETVKITLNVKEQCGYYRCGSFPGVSNAIGQLFVNNGKCERHGDGTHTISFDAYNVGSAYGVVCVYNENGTLEKVHPIQPYNKSMGVGVEKLVNACKYIWSDIVNWNNKEISFYEKEGHSEHTKIVLEDISAGSEVVITTDAYQSDYVALYTGLDAFTQIISVLSDWDLQKNDQQKVTQRLLDAIVKAVSKDSAKEELRKKLVHDAAEDITTLTATFGSAKSMEELQEIIRNLSQELEIDVAEIIADTLKSTGYNLTDGVVTAFFPPYKFSTIIDQMVGFTWTMLDLLDNMRSGATEIHVMRHEITNMVTNGLVMVQQENNFSADTVLDTYVVVEANEMDAFNENVFENLTNYKVYNITLRENGIETQPDGKIKITIPIPENVDARKCAVFRIEADGSRTVLTSSVEGDNIVFETDHLSYYIVGEDITKVVENKDNKYIIPVSVAGGIVLCVLLLYVFRRKKQTV